MGSKFYVQLPLPTCGSSRLGESHIFTRRHLISKLNGPKWPYLQLASFLQELKEGAPHTGSGNMVTLTSVTNRTMKVLSHFC